jgi:hypothetical protein
LFEERIVMPLTEEFTAEIESATTASAEAVREANKGESKDGGSAFVPSGDEQKKEDKSNGDTTVSPDKGGKPDPGTGEGGSDNQDGQDGSAKGTGSRDAGGVGDGGHKGTTPAAIMRAINAGISAADAVALGDDKLVDQLVSERQRAERERIESEELEALRAEDAKTAEEKRKAIEDALPKLDEDADPSVVAAFEAMKKLVLDQQTQLDSFRTVQASQSSAVDAVREREVTSWFEGKVTALSDSFDKVLGKDGVNAVVIKPETADAIAGKIAVMVEGYRASGLQVPKLDDMFDEVARIVLKEDFARLDEAQLAERMEKRAAQDISRPGGSKSKTERSPTDEVADMLNKRYFADRS